MVEPAEQVPDLDHEISDRVDLARLDHVHAFELDSLDELFDRTLARSTSIPNVRSSPASPRPHTCPTRQHPPRRPAPARAPRGRPVASPVVLLPAVEGVVHQQPARRPIVLGSWPDLGSAYTVALGRAGVVADKVSYWHDVKRVGHRLHSPSSGREWQLPSVSPLCKDLVLLRVVAGRTSW